LQLLWFATFFVFLSWEPFGTPPSNIYNLVLAIVLLIVIVSSSLFTFFQELQSSRVLSVFKQMLPGKCIVIRAGVPTLVPASQLVLGDIIQLQAGSRVPADIRIVAASNVKVDKSMLTGEVEPVKLTDKATNHVTLLEATNTAFMGTSIVEGSGKGVVFAVGQQTQLAKIAIQSSGDSKATSLQRELNRFVLIIGAFAFLTGGIVMSVWGGWLNKDHEGFMNTATMIANAISVIVAFVPEGLPLALSVGLTIIARRLCSACFVLVKQLSTVETLGSVSLIASDKTGTLTQNKMTVVNLITGGATEEAVAVTGKAEWVTTHKTTPFVRAVAISALCNQASIKTRGVGRTETEESVDVEIAVDAEPVIVGGNGIDRALLGWAQQYDSATVRATSSVVATLPFSSEKKVAMSIIRDNVSFQATVMLKGAPEYVLHACTHYYRADGSVYELSEAIISQFMEAQEKLASRGRRLVALAELPLSLEEFSPLYTFGTDPTNFPTVGMRLVCMVAVSDPPRVGVFDTIQQLRGAGIRIAMVTGDAASTALAIAKEVGIVTVSKPDIIKTWKPSAHVTSSLADAFIAPSNNGMSSDGVCALVQFVYRCGC
jgi:sodium/potassium-transporting ATPase subunit alpha